MKHKVLETIEGESTKTKIVQLIPENEDERSILSNVEVYEAEYSEREVVDDYVNLLITPPAGYVISKADQLPEHKMSITYIKE